MTDPIERLKDMNEVDIQNAGKLLLAAVMTPIVTGFTKIAEVVAAIFNFPIGVLNKLTEGVGEFVISVLAGAGGMIGASFGAGEEAFREGVWGTLGPVAPIVGTVSLLSVTGIMALYFREESTADSIAGLFTATDIPLLGADEQ